MTREQIRKELERLGISPGFSTRAAGMRVVPESFDTAARSVRFVATTEQPATVWDWDKYDFVEEVLRMDGMVIPATGSVPLLDTHSRASVEDVLGSAADFKDFLIGDLAGKDCLVSFSSVRQGQDAATKVSEGHITDVSVGYRVTEAYFVPEGQKQIIGGKEYEGPVKVSTRWELRELSLVPIGADSLAKVRALVSGPAQDAVDHQRQGETEMKKCPKCGKDWDGQRCDCGHRAENLDDGAGAPAEPSRAMTAADVRAITDKAMADERARAQEIHDAVAAAGLDYELGRSLVSSGVSVDAARAQIIAKLKERGPALGAGGASGFEVGTEGGEKFRAAAVDGMLQRSGMRIEKPAPGANDFRGMSLLDVARESLERSGVRTRGMSKRELAGRALSPASSSDFPSLMSNVAGRRLIAAYSEAPATWRPMVTVTSASDFKDIYGVQLSGSPDLLDLDQNGEYKTAGFSDKQEKYRVVTKGRTVKLTRTMIINDDLRAFVRIPVLFGNAGRRMESDVVWSLITGNPVMADGKTLFHADHNNLEATPAMLGTINSGNLSSARTIMRKQKGLAGETLDLSPAFALVPVEQETDSEILLRSMALPEASMSSGVMNPWAGKLIPIAEPRLSDSSTKAWYIIASPSQAPVIEVAYLEGEEMPYIEEEIEFSSDALAIKVRHDFGAGIMSHVGIVKNPGE